MSVFLGAIKSRGFGKELPLPKSTIKTLINLRDSFNNDYNYSDNKELYFSVNGVIKNTINYLYDYEYKDSIKTLNTLKNILPNAINYDKHSKLILQAQKRYEKI